MQSIEQSVYIPGEEIVFSEWAGRADGSCRRIILCTACALHHELTRSDTFAGNISETNKAEKVALQWMIERGCKHITRGPGTKSLSPSEIAGEIGKGKSRAAGAKGAAKK
jgi:hypothetical protein